MVCRGVRGLRKGSKKEVGGCGRNRGLRFRGRLRVEVLYRSVFTSIILLVNHTKT